MNDFESWAQSSKHYKQLRAVDNMNYNLWGHNSTFYEQLMTMDDMNESRLSVERSRSYEQLKVVGEINIFGSWAQGSKWYK